MLTCMDTCGRIAQAFEEVFMAADPRFKFVNIHRPLGSPLPVEEIRFLDGK